MVTPRLRRCWLVLLLGLLILPAAQGALAQGTEVTVPDVTGLSVPEAAAVLNRAGLALGVETPVGWTPEAAVQPNSVVAQSVAAGQVVAGGTAIDVTVARQANALLLYDDNDLTLVNQTGSTVNLTRITFNALDGTSPASFAASRWAADLRPDQCVQVWSVGRNGPKGLDECQYIQNWLWTGNGAEHFWTGANGVTRFNVVQDGVERAVCEIAARRCEFYLAAGEAGEVTDYVYFAYTTDRLIIHNPSPDRWMPLRGVVLQNYFAPGGPYAVPISDPTLYSSRSPVASLERLAPGQCILFTDATVSVTAPPERCDVIAELAIGPELLFWAGDFGIVSPISGEERTCPARTADHLTLCVMPR